MTAPHEPLPARPRDRVRLWRRRAAAAWLAAAPLLALGAWGAVRASEVAPRLPAVPSPPTTAEADGGPDAPPLDARAFARRLGPAPPPAPPLPAEPPARVAGAGIELLGIARDGDALVAALYDPRDDRIHLVRDGTAIGEVVVREVTELGVTLAEGSATRRVRMVPPARVGGASAPGAGAPGGAP